MNHPNQLYDLSDTASVITALEENFREKMSYLPSLHSEMKVLQEGEITYIHSLTSSDTFNCAFGGDFNKPHSLKSAKKIYNYYINAQLPMAWWVGPTSDPVQREVVFEEAGFKKNEVETGMAALLSEVTLDVTLPSGFHIVEATHAKQMGDFAGVLASVFNPTDPEVIRFHMMVSDQIDFKKGPSRFFIGYELEKPATIGGLFFTKKLACVYDVATHPQHRKKGYATFLTAHVLGAAQTAGYQVIGLEASQDGIHLYKKMGFKPFCEFHVYGILF